MFYLLIAISVIGYSIHATLIVGFSRKIDPLSLAVYRNISLIFSMLPLLFFATTQELAGISNYKPLILIIGLSGTAGLTITYRSFLYLPVGISVGARQAAGVLAAVLFGLFFFQEFIGSIQLLAVIMLPCGIFILSKSHNPMPHLNSSTMMGLFLSIMSGVFISFSFFIMGKLARELGPAVSGYFLEASIGFCSLIVILLRRILTGKGIEFVSVKTFFSISLVSLPILVGTGAAAWAVTIGPFGTMRAYSSSGILLTVFLSHMIYKEHLKTIQWIGIITIVTGIIMLRLG